MEVAIPLALLGGIYFIDKEEKNKEGITNMNTINNRALPNTQNVSQNYPVKKQLGQQDLTDNINYYQPQKAASNEYQKQSEFQAAMQAKIPAAKAETANNLLSGETFDSKNFKHNNMVPFFGRKVTQLSPMNQNGESVLDNLQGNGSQFIRKKEQGPLFTPEENNQWTHGTPNFSGFYQSRVNPGTCMNNVKPFESQNVAPGLNQGYGTEGSGGFNSGLESREQWIAKTVDELRVKTNPKQTFEGRFLPGNREVQNRGIIGKVESYKPDSYYINNPDRYFTQVGMEKGQTLRPIEEVNIQNRDTANNEYYGGQGAPDKVDAPYTKGVYKDPKRAQLDPYSKHITNAHLSTGHGNYGADGYKAVNTNRYANKNKAPNLGIMSGIINAVTSPLMDVLKPSRKENVVHNTRGSGGAGHFTSGGHAADLTHLARTTNRETLDQVDTTGQAFTSAFAQSGAAVNEHQARGQQRETTTSSYSGVGGAAHNSQMTNRQAERNARLNSTKEIVSHIGQYERNGNMALLNSNINQVNKSDIDRSNPQSLAPQNIYKAPPTAAQMGGLSNNMLREAQNNQLNNSHIQQLTSNPYHLRIN
jgi:hypothetical protein